MSSPLWPLQTFESNADVYVVERHLPHWAQAGCLCFLTWRTIDSLPRSVVARWHADREHWLSQHGIDGKQQSWTIEFGKLSRADQVEFRMRFSNEWQSYLDECYGACVLKNPELAKLVQESLLRFDNDLYQLTDFVIMPNHVHIIAAFADEKCMLKQCCSWKHFTARLINQRLSTKGKFWQADGFDHLIRSTEQFEGLQKYIAQNPEKAKLREGQFLHYSRKELLKP